jgi:hypothetical protein
VSSVNDCTTVVDLVASIYIFVCAANLLSLIRLAMLRVSDFAQGYF